MGIGDGTDLLGPECEQAEGDTDRLVCHSGEERERRGGGAVWPDAGGRLKARYTAR